MQAASGQPLTGPVGCGPDRHVRLDSVGHSFQAASQRSQTVTGGLDKLPGRERRMATESATQPRLVKRASGGCVR